MFVVIFALLEKTKLLGDDKRNANLIVSLIIGILFIGVQSAVGFTLKIIPAVAVLIMILLCFWLIFGFIYSGATGLKGFHIALGIVFAIAFIVIILWATGIFSRITSIGTKSNTIAIVALMAVIGGAIALVITQSGKK
jgi:hypothetical protein